MENLVDEKHNEFVEKFRAAGSRALQYAWERNACNILMEAEERRRLDPDKCEPMSVAIVVNVLYHGRTQAKVQVDKLSYKRTMKFCDDDFPEEVVDLEQLEFDFPSASQDASEADDEQDDVGISSPKVRAITNAAYRLKCKAVFPCQQGSVPNWERSVRVVSNSGSRIVLLPSGQEEKLMDAMAGIGELVVMRNGMLHPRSIEKLLLNGYDVRYFDSAGVCRGAYVIEENADSSDYGNLRLDAENLVEANAETFIYQEESIIANVW
ncbi:MAG: hypothetical protein IJT83_15170 [Victivallales bacterium]|nr:hypothetical protein [Victivallales bacterium]